MNLSSPTKMIRSKSGMNSPTEFPWPRVIQVDPLDHQRLRVRLASGEERLLDHTDLLARREAYWRLRQPRYFRQVGIDPLGGLCWPEGEDLGSDGLARYYCLRPSEKKAGSVVGPEEPEGVS